MGGMGQNPEKPSVPEVKNAPADKQPVAGQLQDDVADMLATPEKKELTPEDLEKAQNYQTAQLLKLERDKKGTLSNYYLNEQKDKTLYADFRGNERAYWNIGAGDMLPITVRKIKVTDDKGNIREGVRYPTFQDGNVTRRDRVGYYDDDGYIPVFSGYKIDIVEVDEKFANRTELESEEKSFYDETITAAEINDKLEIINDLTSKLIAEVKRENPNMSHKDAMEKAAELAKKKAESATDEEEKKNLELASEHCKKMAEAIANMPDFDINRYLREIASIESGAKGYMARNDRTARQMGVSHMKYAWGKYQFITSTLLDYGVDLRGSSGIDESKVQDFLHNHELQETIMLKYTMKNLTKWQANGTLENLQQNGISIGKALAAAHLGGPGKVRENGTIAGMTDYFGTSGSGYMSRVS
ncbi:MAG: hypothetical protein WC873_01715 [Candidatus Gracilibacteria bacterium]